MIQQQIMSTSLSRIIQDSMAGVSNLPRRLDPICEASPNRVLLIVQIGWFDLSRNRMGSRGIMQRVIDRKINAIRSACGFLIIHPPEAMRLQLVH